MKIFDHTVLLQIDSNREMFTKHGLPMNDKGKELATKKDSIYYKTHISGKNKRTDLHDLERRHNKITGKP
jgi:hypothetical protein